MNYYKQCWSCGSKSMESKGSYSQCAQCGATHNDLPTGGVLPIVVERVDASSVPGGSTVTKYRPHGVIARRAKKARERDK